MLSDRDEEPLLSRPEKPHVTLYYLFGSASLLGWFVFGVPRMFVVYPELRTDSAVLVHLAASFVTIVCCICNHLWSPKVLGERRKILHILCGRLGCVASCVGAIFGEIRVFLDYVRTGSMNYLLVAVGIWQFYCTVRLFLHAKKSQRYSFFDKKRAATPTEPDEGEKQAHTKLHIHYAHCLFYTACLGPLWARLFNVDDPTMGIYGKTILVDWLHLSAETCLVVLIASNVLMPNLLMRASTRARERKTFL